MNIASHSTEFPTYLGANQAAESKTYCLVPIANRQGETSEPVRAKLGRLSRRMRSSLLRAIFVCYEHSIKI